MLLLIVLTKCKTKKSFVKKYIKRTAIPKLSSLLLSVIQKKTNEPKSNLEIDREQERS